MNSQGPAHTNFKLSGTGEAVAIFDRDGVTLLDSITFGPQVSDVAYGRYTDGSGTWDFIATPTPGAANASHNSPPDLSATQRDVERPMSSDVVVVTTIASDNSAVVSVTLHYDVGGGEVPVAMLDDGLSGDGAASDGIYGAQIPAFSNDTVVDYWVSAIDDLGATRVEPATSPVFPMVYVVGYIPPPLTINEFMATNQTTISDPEETLAFEDWVEIYNAGDTPISLDGMYMSDNLSDPTLYALPSGLVVPAQGHLLLWADQEPLQGINHLDFRLAAAGEEIGLFDIDARGNVPIDVLSYGLQAADISEARCPDGFDGFQPIADASPGTPNQGETSCPSGDYVSLYGTAEGGQVDATINGVLIVVFTAPGASGEDVAQALADAINADPTLAGAGIIGSVLGSEVYTSGTFENLSISDPGISTSPPPPPPPALETPGLGPVAMGLLLMLLAATGLRVARIGNGTAMGA